MAEFGFSTPKNNNKRKYYDDAERAFQVLRHLMENLRARTEEARFFGLELEARRRKNPVSAEGVLLFAYKITSNYGQNILQTAISFILVNLIFWIIYFAMPFQWQSFPALSCETFELHAQGTTMFTLEQIFRPFNIWNPVHLSRIQTEVFSPSLLDWLSYVDQGRLLVVRILCSLQSFLSALLFALLLIVIRRKFQLS